MGREEKRKKEESREERPRSDIHHICSHLPMGTHHKPQLIGNGRLGNVAPD